MDITCISDLHGHYPQLDDGDLVIVAGDLMARDEYEELDYFERWLKVQNYKKKIVIAGNPNILIMKVKYDKTGKEPCIMYNAHITCYVAEVDATFQKIQGRAFQIKHGLLADEIEEHMEK